MLSSSTSIQHTTPIIRNFGNNLQQSWYVEFSYYCAITKKKYRLRYKSGRRFGLTGLGNRSNTKRERLKYFSKLQAKISAKLSEGWTPVQHKGVDMAKLKFSNIVEVLQFALEHKRQFVSDNTFQDYSRRLNQFIHFLKSEGLEKEKPKYIGMVEITKYLKTFSGATNANNHKRVLRLLFQVMVDFGITKVNPAKIKDRKAIIERHKTYTPELAAQILSAAKEHFPNLYLCILLEYYCFIRPHMEIRRLESRDIDLRKMTVTVRAEISKTGESRTLPINEAIVSAIPQQSNSKYLFGQLYNKYYFNTQFSRLKSIVDIPENHTLYSFKHTGCVALYNHTKDIYLVSKMCGHKSIRTTEKYLRGLGIQFQQLQSNPVPELTIEF